MTVGDTLNELDAMEYMDMKAMLRKVGGVPRDPCVCPVARYLHQKTGLYLHVVPPFVDLIDVRTGRSTETIPLPNQVVKFIRWFDSSDKGDQP